MFNITPTKASRDQFGKLLVPLFLFFFKCDKSITGKKEKKKKTTNLTMAASANLFESSRSLQCTFWRLLPGLLPL